MNEVHQMFPETAAAYDSRQPPPILGRNAPRDCWCGVAAGSLESFSGEYRRCPACETLVSFCGETGDITRITDERTDLYGREYWFGHQAADLGQPTIQQRARTDLYERVLHWLKVLWKYRRPPGRLLELGCAHGGFVYFSQVAGFEAMGLELSPSIAQFAASTFQIPVMCGPVERQNIEPASLDVMAAMDVLEHLPDPLATLRHCATLLRPDGMLMVQTPQYPAPLSLERLQERNDRFLDHLRVPREHIYLFSRAGVQILLNRAGFSHVLFEKAIFDHYDMLVLAGSEPIRPEDTDGFDFLEGDPSRRLLLALLDADRCYHRLRAKYDELARSTPGNRAKPD